MYEVHLSDQVYQLAVQAAEAQRISVEDFVAEAVQLHAQHETQNLDYLFTPEMLTAIDESAKEVRDGKSFPIEEMRKDRVERRKTLLDNHPS